MKLFAKGKGEKGGKQQAPAFTPINRIGLLGLLDQVVNGGQSGVLELHEPRGNWVYAFQAGALTHASGGRVRGARQAFDLLWEFQSGDGMFMPGPNPSLAGNLYIDRGRLLDLLHRSQAALQGPSAPYIPPDQQRPIAPVHWQPGAPPGQSGGAPVPPPQQGWPPAAYPQQPGYQPPPPPPGYQQQPGYPAAPYPGAQPQGQPYPPPAYPQPPARGPMRPPAGPPQPGYPAYPQPQMPPQAMPPQAGYPAYPQPQMPPQAMPAQPPLAAQPPAAPRAPARPGTPPSFNVPPMAIPRKREALPTYQPPAGAPAPPVAEPARPTAPTDDLAALRASLVAQAPPIGQAPSGGAWGVRTAEGTVAPPETRDRKAAGKGKGKGKGKDKGVVAQGAKAKRDSKLMAAIKVQLIKFLLWSCERRYSPEDRWTLKDAFEISTMELRDQFIGAFSQSFQSSKKTRDDIDDDADNMAAGRMRGRGRRH